jgi:hypothetical protein
MTVDPWAMLEVAYSEARKGLSEGGIPIGAAMFDRSGVLLGSGRNRRVQQASARRRHRPPLRQPSRWFCRHEVTPDADSVS